MVSLDILSSIVQFLPLKSVPKVAKTSMLVSEAFLLKYPFDLSPKDIFEEQNIRTLIKNDNLTEKNRNVLFCVCIGMGLRKTVKKLMTIHTLDPSFNDNLPIVLAVSNRDLKMIKILLKNSKVDFVDTKNNAISEACSRGYFEISRYLFGLVDFVQD